MKAKLLSDGRKIFHRKKRKQPRRSLSLDECLDSTFVFDRDPVKMNIKAVSELRNNAIHLVIPFVPPDIMGLFQAGVLNYPKMLEAWFGIGLSDRVPLGMMALIYDFDPKIHSLEHAKMSRKLPSETIRWLTAFQQDVRNKAASLGDQTAQFYIPINLKLAIVRNPNRADIVLSVGAAGQKTLISEVPKDIDKSHPHRGKEVIALVNQKVGKPIINSYDIVCVRRLHNIEQRADFYYKSKHTPRLYSERFVEWLISKYDADQDFFLRMRNQAKAMLNDKEK
jgi:hypothetical protein